MKISPVIAAALALASLTACETRTRQDATGETHTTAAPSEELKRAGREIGAAAGEAAEEVKGAARKLDDVKLDDVRIGDGCLGGCDGGAPAARRR